VKKIRRDGRGLVAGRWWLVAGIVGCLLIGAAGFEAEAQKAGKAKAEAKAGTDMVVVSPESEGFSTARLDNLHRLIQGEIDQKQLAGAITILARHGNVVDYQVYGQRDMATGASMTKDTIFRDYSMTKPVTGVAMMILYEEGKWLPWDPIAKYIPEFKGLKVFGGFDKDGKMVLVDPAHAPTMAELMSHSAGFSYGNGHGPVDALYQEVKPMQSANLEEFVEKMAKLPLNYQPGKAWMYSASMDIEGYHR
jgi:CubicO group peptidase (beta-lactamase class C family)